MNGIDTSGPEHVISNNKICFDRGGKCRGIKVGGGNVLIEDNAIIVSNPVFNGYSSPVASRGIGIYGDAAGSIMRSNLTSGFDVGVGPAIPHQVIPHTVIDHTSVGDQLGVDPLGLIAP